MKNRDRVLASEIGDFVYCKRGWWLKLNGLLNENSERLELGNQKHEQLEHRVSFYKIVGKLAVLLILLALLAILLNLFK